MAKVRNNVVTEGLSGKLGKSKYCFKQAYGETVFGLKSVSSVEPNDNQRLMQEKFKSATEKARVDMADPEKRAAWAAKCGGKFKKPGAPGYSSVNKFKYCASCWEKKRILGGEIQKGKERKYVDARYYGLNLHSWMMRGTVEWRSVS